MEKREKTQLTAERIMDIMCAPNPTDEPEESDFVGGDRVEEKTEEIFVRDWIARSLSDLTDSKDTLKFISEILAKRIFKTVHF
jgi:hypothetical protein